MQEKLNKIIDTFALSEQKKAGIKIAINVQTEALMAVITAIDLTLPSYPVKNGIPYTDIFDPSPMKDLTDLHALSLKTAIKATGKIRLFNVSIGTGFLIAPNLIVTNRHVLQDIAREDNGVWTFNGKVSIDFGDEIDVTNDSLKKSITKVVFTSRSQILANQIDFSHTDIALLEIQPDENMPEPLKVNRANNITQGDKIFVIGFPNQRKVLETDKPVYAAYFENFINSKKVAPGNIIQGTGEYAGRLCHNASTLAGNSGSLIVKAGADDVAMAIHFGGTTKPPRENWCHDLNYYCTPGITDCLKDYFDQYNVQYSAL